MDIGAALKTFLVHATQIRSVTQAVLYEEYVPSVGSREGARGGHPPYFQTKLRPEESKKNFFLRPRPPYLRVWMIGPPLPPPPSYLKVQIHYWYRSIFHIQFSVAFDCWAPLLFSYETGRQLYNNPPAVSNNPLSKMVGKYNSLPPQGVETYHRVCSTFENCHPQDKQANSNISSMRRSVSSPDETLRRELKIRRAAEQF